MAFFRTNRQMGFSLSYSIIVVLLALLALSCCEDGYVCHHDEIMETLSDQIEEEKKEFALLASKVRRGKADSKFYALPTPGDYIRIYIDVSKLEDGVDAGYTCYTEGETVDVIGTPTVCTGDMVLTTAKKDYLISLVNDSINYIAKTFLVVPEVPGIDITSSTCGYLTGLPVQVYAGYDYVLYVTGRPTTGSVLAYATACGFASRFRPKSGYANFGPSNLDSSKKNIQYYTSVHEITHALGFTYSRMGYFVDSAGFPVSSSYVIDADAPGVADGQPQIKIITSPLIKEFIQGHFDCPTLQGAALEDGGSSGTASSHWEKRIYYDEYMVGSVIYSPVISELTLRFFDDSGWYAIDYSHADVSSWGYKEGCTFATAKCSNWDSTYFCLDYAKTPQCSVNRRGRGYCDIFAGVSALDTWYQYFSQSNVGGLDYLADYCPRTQALEFCGDFSIWNSDMENYGESLGFDSLCYISSLVKNDKPLSHYDQPRCHESICLSETDLRFKVDGYWYPCDSEGSAQVDGYRNSLRCPNTMLVCHGVAATDNSSLPTFSSVSPSSGSAKGGTTVTIRGGKFHENCTVMIGGVNASSVQWFDSTKLVAVTSDATSIVKTTTKVNVMIINPGVEYGALGYGKFEMEWSIFDILRSLPYIGTFIGYALDYAIAYPIIAGLLIFVLIGVAGFICFVFQAYIIKRNYHPKRKAAKKKKVHPKSVNIEDPESHMYFNHVSKITYGGSGMNTAPGKIVF